MAAGSTSRSRCRRSATRRAAIIGAAAFTRDISMRIAAEERLRRSEAQLAEAQELAALGSWEWDLVSDEIAWSPQFYRILGRDPDRSAPTKEGYFDAIHPADRPHGPMPRSSTRSRPERRSTSSAGRCGPMASNGSSMHAGGRSRTTPARWCGCSERSRTSPTWRRPGSGSSRPTGRTRRCSTPPPTGSTGSTSRDASRSSTPPRRH